MKDFLGTEIKTGARGIRVHSYSHNKSFKKITVKDIDESRKHGDCIAIVTDGNTKIGWTYPERIIIQDSLKIQI